MVVFTSLNPIEKASTRIYDVDAQIAQVQYSADGQNILARERGDDMNADTISVYDVRSGEVLHRIGGTSAGLGASVIMPFFRMISSYSPLLYQVYQTSLNHTGELAYATGGNGSVAILSYPSLEPLDKLVGHMKSCQTVSVDPRGRYIATGGSNALLNLWEVQDWICVRTIPNAE